MRAGYSHDNRDSSHTQHPRTLLAFLLVRNRVPSFCSKRYYSSCCSTSALFGAHTYIYQTDLLIIITKCPIPIYSHLWYDIVIVDVFDDDGVVGTHLQNMFAVVGFWVVDTHTTRHDIVCRHNWSARVVRNETERPNSRNKFLVCARSLSHGSLINYRSF